MGSHTEFQPKDSFEPEHFGSEMMMNKEKLIEAEVYK